MKKYTPLIGFLILMLMAIGMNVFSAYAVTTVTFDPSSIPRKYLT